MPWIINPEARILVLTTCPGDAQAVRALKAGAAGYLLKSSLRTELMNAIRNVHGGQRYVLREVATGIALHIVDDALNNREIAVLRLVAVGKANKQVASQLGVSEETVKGYFKNIFAKLDVRDTPAAVAALSVLHPPVESAAEAPFGSPIAISQSASFRGLGRCPSSGHRFFHLRRRTWLA